MMNLKLQLDRAVKLSALTLVSLLLTGCWDSVEINNRSVILEFAIDKYLGDNDTARPLDDQNRFAITYSIPDMAKLSGTASLVEDMKTNILVTAPTIATSLDDLETRTRNTITFSHVKVVLIGEELLKDPKLLQESLDAMTRGRLIARNVPLLAVKGKTEDAINIENTQQPILGLYIMNYFNNKERPRAYFKPQLLGNFVRDMQDTGVATIPIFHIPEDAGDSQNAENIAQDNDEQGGENALESEGSSTGQEANSTGYEISGGAVIKDYELVDYIDKDIVKGQLIIDGDAKNMPVVVEHQNSPVSFILERCKRKVKFAEIEGQMSVIIEIRASGDIAEYHPKNGVLTQEDVDEIQVLLQNELVRQASGAVNKAKELNVDFLGIGQQMYRKYVKLWADYEATWEADGFRQMPVYLDVSVEAENTGVFQ